ncbi:hypothetical protein GWK47_042211 [Chionoecetes opilio]|uniref:Uncharacterized protein n=1 Tax=Chionoecetes opilio TaxID=41210 RepID=A0A8J5D071_CHIOP|nr:hypothetical protein GWK47_042211 [Chionoecetes opilio]
MDIGSMAVQRARSIEHKIGGRETAEKIVECGTKNPESLARIGRENSPRPLGDTGTARRLLTGEKYAGSFLGAPKADSRQKVAHGLKGGGRSGSGTRSSPSFRPRLQTGRCSSPQAGGGQGHYCLKFQMLKSQLSLTGREKAGVERVALSLLCVGGPEARPPRDKAWWIARDVTTIRMPPAPLPVQCTFVARNVRPVPLLNLLRVSSRFFSGQTPIVIKAKARGKGFESAKNHTLAARTICSKGCSSCDGSEKNPQNLPGRNREPRQGVKVGNNARRPITLSTFAGAVKDEGQGPSSRGRQAPRARFPKRPKAPCSALFPSSAIRGASYKRGPICAIDEALKNPRQGSERGSKDGAVKGEGARSSTSCRRQAYRARFPKRPGRRSPPPSDFYGSHCATCNLFDLLKEGKRIPF